MGNLRRLVFAFAFLFSALSLAAAPAFLTGIHRATLEDPLFNKSYLKSGCFVRAHWIADLIQKSGHQPLKVFVTTGSVAEKMRVQGPTGKTISWTFHVAAGFKDPAGEIWVVDPILTKEVVTVTQWMALMESQNPQIHFTKSVTGPEVYHVDPFENEEFQNFGSPFSKPAMDFVKDAMAMLFVWDTFE
jgi:hypothetical protein